MQAHPLLSSIAVQKADMSQADKTESVGGDVFVALYKEGQQSRSNADPEVNSGEGAFNDSSEEQELCACGEADSEAQPDAPHSSSMKGSSEKDLDQQASSETEIPKMAAGSVPALPVQSVDRLAVRQTSRQSDVGETPLVVGQGDVQSTRRTDDTPSHVQQQAYQEGVGRTLRQSGDILEAMLEPKAGNSAPKTGVDLKSARAQLVTADVRNSADAPSLGQEYDLPPKLGKHVPVTAEALSSPATFEAYARQDAQLPIGTMESVSSAHDVAEGGRLLSPLGQMSIKPDVRHRHGRPTGAQNAPIYSVASEVSDQRLEAEARFSPLGSKPKVSASVPEATASTFALEARATPLTPRAKGFSAVAEIKSASLETEAQVMQPEIPKAQDTRSQDLGAEAARHMTREAPEPLSSLAPVRKSADPLTPVVHNGGQDELPVMRTNGVKSDLSAGPSHKGTFDRTVFATPAQASVSIRQIVLDPKPEASERFTYSAPVRSEGGPLQGWFATSAKKPPNAGALAATSLNADATSALESKSVRQVFVAEEEGLELGKAAEAGGIKAIDEFVARRPADAAPAPRLAASDARWAVNSALEAMSKGGKHEIELQLSPEELGRVRFKMIASEGQIVVQVFAEKAETLEAMRRHADVFSQDLTNSGYENASFQFDQQSPESSGAEHGSDHDEGPNDHTVQTAGALRPVRHAANDRIDIRV